MPDPIKYRPTLAPSTAKALNEEGKRAQADMPAYLKGLVEQIQDPGARTVFENRLNYITQYAPYTGQDEDFKQFLRVITDYSGIAGRPSVDRFSGFQTPEHRRGAEPWMAGISQADVRELKDAGYWDDIQRKLDNMPIFIPGRAMMTTDIAGNNTLGLALPKDYDTRERSDWFEDPAGVYDPDEEWGNFIAEMSHAVDANMRYRTLPKPVRGMVYGAEALGGGIRTAAEGEVPWRSNKQYQRPGAMEHRTHDRVEPYYWNPLDNNRSVDPRYVVRATPWR